MKKVLLVSTVLSALLLLNVKTKAQSQRLQLIEYFDNSSLPPSIIAANKHFDTLAYANSGRVIVIKYHAYWGWVPYTDSMNLQNPVQVATRINYYQITATADAIQDGAAAGQGTFHNVPAFFSQSNIDSRDSIPAPFTITLSHSLNAAHDTILCHAVIVKTDTATGTAVAHVVVMEKLIHFNVPAEVGGETNFDHVMKRMLPDDAGTALPAMNIGDSIVLDLSWGLANVYDTTQLEVVCFVQNNTTHEIYQSGYSPPTVHPNDAGISAITNVPGYSCDSIVPEIILSNAGADTMRTCTINYQIDNASVNNFQWSGTLAPDSSVLITLPSFYFAGYHRLKVFTSNPNGNPDIVTINDTLFTFFSNASAPVSIPFMEGFETSWPPLDWGIESTNYFKAWQQGMAGGFGNSLMSAKLEWYDSWSRISDDLDLPVLDFSTNTNPLRFEFNVAYARINSSSYDTLKVNVSTDCGVTWSTVYSKGRTALATAPDNNMPFTPTASQWRHEVIDLTSYNGQSDVLVQFHAINGYGNNLYLDDINISILTAIESPDVTNHVDIFPNPSSGNFTITSDKIIQNGIVELFNVFGKKIYEEKINFSSKKEINLKNISSGIYFIKISYSEKVMIRKIVVER